MFFVRCFGLVLELLSGIGALAAQQPAQVPERGRAAQAQMTIDAATLTILIRGAVMALQQANQTGNYSVLRDLGTPVFREQLDQTALAAAFSNLRGRKINLSPALLIAPTLAKNPELGKSGELVLVGDFPTQPLRIHFELAFLQLDGVWRISGIAVDAVPPPNGAQASAVSPPAAWAPSAGKPVAPTKTGKRP